MLLAILDSLAQEMRQLHFCHISSNSLTLQNIFVDPENSYRVYILDFRNAKVDLEAFLKLPWENDVLELRDVRILKLKEKP